jgi:hypothetical protein
VTKTHWHHSSDCTGGRFEVNFNDGLDPILMGKEETFAMALSCLNIVA